MHPTDDVDCPFREVVLEAIKELEETKSLFSEVTEKVKLCENKLNNVLNVILKSGTLARERVLYPHNRIQNISNSEFASARNHPAVNTTGLKDCLADISSRIKTEPVELNESENFLSSDPSNSTLFSSRKRSSLLDASVNHMQGETNKRCRSEGYAEQHQNDFESKPITNHENKVVAGSVIPVFGNSTQEDASHEQQIIREFPSSKRSDLSTDCLFSQLSDIVCQNTLNALKDINFTRMMEVQSRVIRPFLCGKNMVVFSERGSGKTLAYLIPAVEIVCRLKFKQRDGSGCIIVCVSNALATQTYGVLMGLMQYHPQKYGLVLKTKSRKSFLPEQNMVAREDMNILVTTPDKFLHCLTLKSINTNKLQCVVFDDTDILLRRHKKFMINVFKWLPSQVQIGFFGTQTMSYSVEVKKLLGPDASFLIVRNKGAISVPGLKHYYLKCEALKRTFFLFKILEQWHQSEKVVVVFKKPFYVNYFGSWLPLFGVPVCMMNEIYGSDAQVCGFLRFCSAKHGILLCTSVLSVGLDIPGLSWVVQYDCDSVEDYSCTTGLTARGVNGKGNSLLLLYSNQKKFVNTLKESGISIQEHTSVDVKTGIEEFHKKLQQSVEYDKFVTVTASEVIADTCRRSLLPQHQSQSLVKAFGLGADTCVWKNKRNKYGKKALKKTRCLSSKLKRIPARLIKENIKTKSSKIKPSK